MRKRSLGRGLDSLIPKDQEAESENYRMVKVDLIKPNASQPRKRFEENSLKELAASVRESGILQPLIVRESGGGFEIVAGERRWRAAQIAKLETLPVLVRAATDREVAELMLIENIQREDLNPLEEAEAYEKLINRFELTHEEVSKKTGKTRSVVTNHLRLLRLSENAKEALVSGTITMGHARALLAAKSTQEMDSLLKEVLEKDLTVRKTEQMARNRAGSTESQPKARLKKEEKEDVFTKELSERLSEKFSTKVSVIKGGKKGKIEIEYYSPEELDRIIGMLFSRG